MAREKKFFSPTLRSYNNDLKKRWRVEYWIPGIDGKDKRICIYGNINKANNVDDRLQAAQMIINSLDFKQPREKNIIDLTIERAELELKHKTLSSYKTIAKSLCDYLAPKSINNLTSQDFEEYLLNLKRKGYNNTTLYNRRLAMNSLFNKAIHYGLTEYNPIVRVKRIKSQASSLMYFTDDQINSIKRHLIDNKLFQLWLAVRLSFYCFIRPGEMRNMKIAWINFDYGFIEIPGEFSKNKKTAKIAIPDQFLNEIQYLRDYPNNYYILSNNNTPGPDRIGQNTLNNQHRKILNELKIRGRYAFYSWKHTGVVKAVKAGINIKDLQLQLRHHSLDMVNEYLKNLGVMDSEDIRHRFPTL